MFRKGLAVYLLLTYVAAPWLCCCTGGRVMDAVAAAMTPSVPTQEESAPVASCCCRNSAANTDNEPAEPTNTPQDHNKCPCEQHQSTQVSHVTARTEINIGHVLFSWGIETSNSPAQLSDIAATAYDLAHRSDQLLLPFLTSGDLLDAHHLLRC